MIRDELIEVLGDSLEAAERGVQSNAELALELAECLRDFISSQRPPAEETYRNSRIMFDAAYQGSSRLVLAVANFKDQLVADQLRNGR